ncbi:hypothetical protein LBMAG56_39840 [Verrucomicrobiota bacterium]|nr:hypothetical protein LBMAG56_39840 [Verrucomicrobiota bacterium]
MEPVLHRDSGAKLEENATPERRALLGSDGPDPALPSNARRSDPPASRSPSAPGDWLTPRRFTALLAVLIGVLFAGVLVGSQSFFFRDFGYFGYPLAQFHREAFWRGEWPLWNPLNNFGLPFLAQWNTLTLYPLSLIYLLLPLPWSLNVFCLAHLLLAGAGMYALAAHWTARPLAAAVAGLAFAFNGLTLHCLMWPNNIAALGWMPWLVLLASRAVNEGGRTLLLAALVGALQMLAGAPEVILLTWTLIATLWLVAALPLGVRPSPAAATSARTEALAISEHHTALNPAAPEDGRTPGVRPSPAAAASARTEALEISQRHTALNPAAPEDGRTPGAAAARRVLTIAARAFALVGLVALLSAAQLLPFLELLGASQRGSGGYAGSEWPMPAWGWANLLVPLFRAFPSHHGVFAQTTQHWTSSYYAGIGVLVLALWAAVRVRDRRAWLLAIITATSLLLALGDAGYLYDWVHRVFPAIEVMRYPVKFVLLADFALPLLAALGVAHLLESSPTTSRTDARSLLAIGAAALALIAVILLIARLHPLADDVWSATWQNGLSRAVLLGLILAACLALRRSSGPGARAARPQVCPTPLADARPRGLKAALQRAAPLLLLLLLLLDILTHMPWQNPTAAAWVYAPREVALDPRPRHGESRAMVSRAALMEMHTSSINDPSRDYLFKRVALYDNCNVLDALPKADGVFSLYLRPQADIHRLLYGSTNAPPAGLLDFLGIAHLTAPGKFVEWTPRPGWQPTATGGQRIAFAPDEQILAALANPAFDSRKTVFLPPAARAEISATNAAIVRFLAQQWSAASANLEVEASAPTVVVLAQTFHPNWRATVNDRAVPVPAGKSRLALTYRDDRFHAGLGISAITFAACAAGWMVAGRRRRTPDL